MISKLPLLLAEQDYWKQEMFGLDSSHRFVLLLTAIGCATAALIAVAGIIAGVYTSVQKRRIQAELKQDMLDRGMTAEDIAKIIEAAPLEDGIDRWVASWGKAKKQD